MVAIASPELTPARERMLAAMTEVVAEKGYAQATVADAVRVARVSRGTFYAEFASKEQCFVEAYRHGTQRIVERVRAAVRASEGGWDARLRAGLRGYLQTLVDEPRFTTAHLFEIHAAGREGGLAYEDSVRQFAQRYRTSFRAAHREHPELAVPSDEALFVLTAGIDQLVCAHIRAGEISTLTSLTDDLLTIAISFLSN